MRQQASANWSAAARYWRAGAYWEVHEVLEPAWRAAAGPEKLFLQGLIMAAAALHAGRLGHARGAAANLEKARRKWERLGESWRGVRLQAFLDDVAAALVGAPAPDWPRLTPP